MLSIQQYALWLLVSILLVYARKNPKEHTALLIVEKIQKNILHC